MSVPVSYCVLVAACDSEQVFQKIKPVMAANLKHGAFTVVGCKCLPPCRDLSGKEANDLLRRFKQ